MRFSNEPECNLDTSTLGYLGDFMITAVTVNKSAEDRRVVKADARYNTTVHKND